LSLQHKEQTVFQNVQTLCTVAGRREEGMGFRRGPREKEKLSEAGKRTKKRSRLLTKKKKTKIVWREERERKNHCEHLSVADKGICVYSNMVILPEKKKGNAYSRGGRRSYRPVPCRKWGKEAFVIRGKGNNLWWLEFGGSGS